MKMKDAIIRRITAVLLVILMLVPYMGVTAKGGMFADSQYWENLTDDGATELLHISKSSKNKSFVFVFYRDTCGYSQKYVPQFLDFAKQNGIKLYGLNDNDYPAWMDILDYSSDNSIGFPMVVAYNHKNRRLWSQDNIHSVSGFQRILEEIGLIGSGAEDFSTGRFKDVYESDDEFDAIEYLAGKEIINGYDDKTFKPENPITRAEAATVIVRAADLSVEDNQKSTYTDVANNFWGVKYIMAATRAGIINGMGNGRFAPGENVTHNQIIKMIICMLSMEEDALYKGGWPYGYLETANEIGILDNRTYYNLLNGEGDESASRGAVAQYVYNALKTENSNAVEVAGKKYSIGMNASMLSAPDEKLPSAGGYTWYVYGTKTYTDFVAVGVSDNKVVSIASVGSGFVYNGYKAGDIVIKDIPGIATDENDVSKVHGIFIPDNTYNMNEETGEDVLAGESKMIFHYTNAFRVLHGEKVLKWSDKAATSAKLHSTDMAQNDYFSHTGKNGSVPADRMSAQGINWWTCGENIYAGRVSGFEAYNAWVNSEGHRNNMLKSDFEYLGVGGGYSKLSKYRAYSTQNFFAQ